MRHRLWGVDLASAILTAVALTLFWAPFAVGTAFSHPNPSTEDVLTVGVGVLLGFIAFGAWLVRSIMLRSDRVVSVWHIISPITSLLLTIIALAIAVADSEAIRPM